MCDGEGWCAVNEDASAFPEPGSPGWMRVQGHPDVARMEVVGRTLRVRLVSGVELEWRRDDDSVDDRSHA